MGFASDVIEYCQKFYNYSFNMAEAAYIRRLSRKVVIENDVVEKNNKNRNSLDCIWIFPEIIDRFLRDFYGINQREQGGFSLKKIFKLIKQKYRPEQEKI